MQLANNTKNYDLELAYIFFAFLKALFLPLCFIVALLYPASATRMLCKGWLTRSIFLDPLFQFHYRRKEIVSWGGGGRGTAKERFRGRKYSKATKAIFQKVGEHAALSS